MARYTRTYETRAFLFIGGPIDGQMRLMTDACNDYLASGYDEQTKQEVEVKYVRVDLSISRYLTMTVMSCLSRERTVDRARMLIT